MGGDCAWPRRRFGGPKLARVELISIGGPESNVRQSQGALEARPALCWVVFVRGEGAVSKARSWQVWS